MVETIDKWEKEFEIEMSLKLTGMHVQDRKDLYLISDIFNLNSNVAGARLHLQLLLQHPPPNRWV